MKANNRGIIIAAIVVFGSIVLFFVLRHAFFEKAEIDDIPQISTFDYDKKDARSFFLFKNLLERSFNEVNQEVEKPGIFESDSADAFIYIGENVSFDEEQSESILEAVKNGKNVFISSNYLSWYHDDFYANISYANNADSLFINESIIRNEKERCNNSYGCNIKYNNLEFESYGYYDNTTILSSEIHYQGYRYGIDSASYYNEVDTIMICKEIEDGQLCIHSMPNLFSNIFSFSPGHLKHYNEVVSVLPSSSVLLVTPARRGETYKNPLRFLWQQRAFKWAFGLLAFLILIYFISESRRKSREIKLVQKKKNTTLKFVDTISRLYFNKGNNNNLFDKMEENFYDFVETRYFINRNQNDFWSKLESKSKASDATINRIKNEFNNKREYSDQELITIYNILNLFYKTAE